MIRVALISSLMLAACAQVPGQSAGGFPPVYNGVKTSLLEGDLVQFQVAMSGARSGADVDDYAEDLWLTSLTPQAALLY